MVCSMMQIVMPSLAQPRQHVQHVVAFLAAEPGQRLVEQQQARMAGQRAGQLHQAELLVGELARGARRHWSCKPNLVQRAAPPQAMASRSGGPAP